MQSLWEEAGSSFLLHKVLNSLVQESPLYNQGYSWALEKLRIYWHSFISIVHSRTGSAAQANPCISPAPEASHGFAWLYNLVIKREFGLTLVPKLDVVITTWSYICTPRPSRSLYTRFYSLLPQDSRTISFAVRNLWPCTRHYIECISVLLKALEAKSTDVHSL